MRNRLGDGSRRREPPCRRRPGKRRSCSLRRAFSRRSPVRTDEANLGSSSTRARSICSSRRCSCSESGTSTSRWAEPWPLEDFPRRCHRGYEPWAGSERRRCGEPSEQAVDHSSEWTAPAPPPRVVIRRPGPPLLLVSGPPRPGARPVQQRGGPDGARAEPAGGRSAACSASRHPCPGRRAQLPGRPPASTRPSTRTPTSRIRARSSRSASNSAQAVAKISWPRRSAGQRAGPGDGAEVGEPDLDGDRAPGHAGTAAGRPSARSAAAARGGSPPGRRRRCRTSPRRRSTSPAARARPGAGRGPRPARAGARPRPRPAPAAGSRAACARCRRRCAARAGAGAPRSSRRPPTGRRPAAGAGSPWSGRGTTSSPSGLAAGDASLATNLVGHPDRAGDPLLVDDPGPDTRRSRRGARAGDRAGHVEERLVQAQRLDQRGDRAEHRHHRPRDLGVGARSAGSTSRSGTAAGHGRSASPRARRSGAPRRWPR